MAEGSRLGEWSFIVGIVIAIIIGIVVGDINQLVENAKSGQYSGTGWFVLLLVLLGLIVGLLNVTEKETTPFLVAAAALLITGTVGDTLLVIPTIGKYLVGIVTGISVFVVPAAIVVAIKAIRSLAKD